MKITALEIEQRQFEKGFRGYDIDEVNRFLANLAQEWEKMTTESKMIKMQLDIAEKEAGKLREVENTLIKTLKTAEEASSRIEEHARLEAETKIKTAETNAARLVSEAENTAKQLIAEAESKSANINVSAKTEYEAFESNISKLEKERDQLIAQLKNIAQHAANLSHSTASIVAPSIPETTKPLNVASILNEPEIIETEAELDIDEPVSFSSAVNSIVTEEPKNDLELIEGIGPKIKEVLANKGILTFRTLATTPIYKIKDILEAAGPQYAIHDPSTWVEQALLAEAGEWEKFEQLKKHLLAGKEPKASRMNDGNNTEEMIDKVNKVKAAIRKSMAEKSEPVFQEPQGSFFDNLK